MRAIVHRESAVVSAILMFSVLLSVAVTGNLSADTDDDSYYEQVLQMCWLRYEGSKLPHQKIECICDTLAQKAVAVRIAPPEQETSDEDVESTAIANCR